MAKFAVLGHGVVGSGTVELFLKNKEQINKKSNIDLDLKYILDIRDFPGLPYSDKFTKDINDILNDDEVTVVAEVMGGVHPAYDFVLACLNKGRAYAPPTRSWWQRRALSCSRLQRITTATLCSRLPQAALFPLSDPSEAALRQMR